MKTIDKSPTTLKIEGNWNQFVGKIKETWGVLTEDNLDQYEGQIEQLQGFIQEKTGQKREEIRSRIDEIANNLKSRV